MEYSKLIGKQVFTARGKLLGYVTGLYLSEDLASASALSCADEEEEEFFLSFDSVTKIGDALIAENKKIEAPHGVPCPVGKTVYDENGSYLGKATSLTSGNSGALTVLSPLGEKEYPAKRICVGDTVFLRAKLNTGSKKPQKKAPEEERAPAEDPDEIYKNNLLGKKLKADLEGIALKGEIVSKQMIARAHESNRLLELTAAVLSEG